MQWALPYGDRGVCYVDILGHTGTCAYAVLRNARCIHWYSGYHSYIRNVSKVLLGARELWGLSESLLPSIPPYFTSSPETSVDGPECGNYDMPEAFQVDLSDRTSALAQLIILKSTALST